MKLVVPKPLGLAHYEKTAFFTAKKFKKYHNFHHAHPCKESIIFREGLKIN